MNRVLHNLRKEAALVAEDANEHIDAAMYVYHWLVNDDVPAVRVDRLPESRVKVCFLIGENFKALGYKAAMRMYMWISGPCFHHLVSWPLRCSCFNSISLS